MNQEQIQDLYEKYKVPLHIREHMKEVSRVAELLADAYTKKGHAIDKTLVSKAALLHDVMRPCDFREFPEKELTKKHGAESVKVWQAMRTKYQEMGHERALAEILRNLDQHDLAKIIEKHDFKKVGELETLEEKILYYADKRVEEDQVVDLKSRLKKGEERNAKPGEDPQKRAQITSQIFALEEEIKTHLDGELPV